MKKYNQILIKDNNKKQIYQLIEEIPGISRAQLAEALKLSKTTVSTLVDELMQEGFVLDEGAMESGRQGRKPNSLVVNSRENGVVVINWKKDSADITLVDSSMGITAVREYDLRGERERLRVLGKAFDTFVQEVCRKIHIMGVCAVVPGMIDERGDQIISVVLPDEGRGNYRICELRQAFSGYPLAVLNDTACFAYAENAFGKLDGDSCIYININDGVGAAIIHDGSLLSGASGMATQFGHFSVDRSGRRCACGNRGCLENQIGELALPRQFQRFGVICGKEPGEKLLFKDLAGLAEQGDPAAVRLMESMAEDLSYALCNAVALFHPEEIIIGGIGRKLGGRFLGCLREKMAHMGFRQFMADVEVDYTELKEDAAVVGAARYYIDHYHRFRDMEPGQCFCG